MGAPRSWLSRPGRGFRCRNFSNPDGVLQPSIVLLIILSIVRIREGIGTDQAVP